MFLGVGNRPDSGVERLLAAHHQLMFEVNVGCGNEDMDAGMFGFLDRLDGFVNIILFCPGKAEDNGMRDEFRDSPHRLKVTLRRGGKPSFDYIDIELFQLSSNQYLLFDVHGCARRLLAVTQCCVENLDHYSFHRVLLQYSTNKKGAVDSRPQPLKTRGHEPEIPPIASENYLRFTRSSQTHQAGW